MKNQEQVTQEAAKHGFKPFDLSDNLPWLYRRFEPGFGRTVAKDDRREWLRWTGEDWMGYAIHTDEHGEDWYESKTFEGSVSEIAHHLVVDRDKAPRLNED